ncbi:Leucine-rich repeat-containing protein 56 [Oryzias melastigma]|uniref:Leucine-rich repeat-containing protein 56 n=1 Tax=Oryzias melastigma TaxID=30732 RepID=A0A834CJ62_ORYME|nr:Leucine-rich repeat-containing protein 56 [Oryzias melastigma]
MLWMSRCGLQDLDGISSFPSLKELHVAFNCLSDLLHVSFLKKLQLLDLEGNEVDNLVDVQCLSSCVKLQTLTLRGNPVCIRPDATCPQVADYSYRASVQELLPQVRYLDNVKVEDRMTTEISDVPGNEFRSSNEGDNVGGAYHHSSGDSSPSSSAVTPSGGSQPSNRSSYGFSESRPAAEHLDSSILLHRSNSVLFCGNPVKAVRANRERLGSAPTRSMLHLAIHQPEDTLDSADVLSELRAWRVQHSSVTQVRLPKLLQVSVCAVYVPSRPRQSIFPPSTGKCRPWQAFSVFIDPTHPQYEELTQGTCVIDPLPADATNSKPVLRPGVCRHVAMVDPTTQASFVVDSDAAVWETGKNLHNCGSV